MMKSLFKQFCSMVKCECRKVYYNRERNVGPLLKYFKSAHFNCQKQVGSSLLTLKCLITGKANWGAASKHSAPATLIDSKRTSLKVLAGLSCSAGSSTSAQSPSQTV